MKSKLFPLKNGVLDFVSMGYLLVVALVTILSCSKQASSEMTPMDSLNVPVESHDEEILGQMQGLWTHMDDSLASVEISGSQWTFKYEGASDDSDKFTITISDTLPAFVDKSVKADFIILSNSGDTMQYEITGLTSEVMSLMFYPRGNTHVYRRAD